MASSADLPTVLNLGLDVAVVGNDAAAAPNRLLELLLCGLFTELAKRGGTVAVVKVIALKFCI